MVFLKTSICWSLPICTVTPGPRVPSNSIVHVHGTNCIFVFFYSFGKCTSCLPYVIFHILTYYFIYLLSSVSFLLSLDISLLYCDICKLLEHLTFCKIVRFFHCSLWYTAIISLSFHLYFLNLFYFLFYSLLYSVLLFRKTFFFKLLQGVSVLCLGVLCHISSLLCVVDIWLFQ